MEHYSYQRESFICFLFICVDKLLLVPFNLKMYTAGYNGIICQLFLLYEDLMNFILQSVNSFSPTAWMRNELSFVWLRFKWPLLHVRSYIVV